MKKKILLIGLAVILLAAGIRIGTVNATSVKPLASVHQIGEWVSLEGGFMLNAEEQTEGYSVRVDKAEVISSLDYAKKHGLPEIQFQVGGIAVLEVTITIRNENNQSGRLMIGEWALLGRFQDYLTYMDPQLLRDTDPRLEDPSKSFATPTQSVRQMVIPFVLDRLPTKKDIAWNEPFRLVVSKYPVRHSIVLNSIA